jgi:hypothetical protein
MSTYKITKVVMDKARIFPWGCHGNIITVGKNSITDIQFEAPDTVIVTDMTASKPQLTIVKDWQHAVIAEDISNKCDKCGEIFQNTQGLGAHKKTCGSNK